VLAEDYGGESRAFGKINLMLKDNNLCDQKSHDLTLNIGVDAKDTVGTLRLIIQYKYRKVCYSGESCISNITGVEGYCGNPAFNFV
jgi:hypothetical protein